MSKIHAEEGEILAGVVPHVGRQRMAILAGECMAINVELSGGPDAGRRFMTVGEPGEL
jgi:hypothetical protein